MTINLNVDDYRVYKNWEKFTLLDKGERISRFSSF